MDIASTLTLLQLCLSAAAAVSGDGVTETAVTAAPGDVALLPCYSVGNETPSLTTWTKNGAEVSRGGGPSAGPPPAGQRLAVQHDGSLVIGGVVPGDEGSYLCSSTLPSSTFQARVLLQVASGPDNISVSISASTSLPNGTSVAYRGSSVSFRCSASSYPNQQLTLAFAGASSSNNSLVSTLGPLLDFRIGDIQPGSQGVYSCSAFNAVSNQRVNESAELLVYYLPEKHPECMWVPSPDLSQVQVNCSWFGAYPTPELRWGDDGGGRVADSLLVTLNSSLLSDGQTVKCAARHQLLGPGTEKTCSLTFKFPYPEGEPLAAALEATNVTLTCSEASSVPAANTTWRKGQQQDVIVPGSKYVLTEAGPVLQLTIVNVSRDDEGVYFCRSENPLAVRELEVYLTVKTASSAYTGAIIGVFIAVLIAASAAVVAKTLYASRHRICLGGGFGQIEEDGGEVLSLVDSDDEQLFQDAVPQLPPLTNGHHTTLVQIHRIPSSDHEDAETADTNSQQPETEETETTEEPDDLVTF